MTFQPLVKGFRVSAAKRPYVSRLRLHGRDFDFGNTPEAAVSYTRCIGEMRSILLQRKVANPVADRAIFRTLQAAVDSQFAQLPRIISNPRMPIPKKQVFI